MSSKGESAMIVAVSAGLLLAGAPAAQAGDGRFDSIADLLASPEFIDDCIRRDGGTITLSFEPTYRGESEPLATAMEQQLIARGAAARVVDHKPSDWDAAASCNRGLTPGLRAEVFITLHKDANGEFGVARVLVRAKDRCEETSLSRAVYPDRCQDARTDAPKAARPPLFAEHGIAVPRHAEGRSAELANSERARERQIGLLVGAALQATVVLGLRSAQAVNVERDLESAKLFGGGAYLSTLGLAVVSAYTARSWREREPPLRRRRLTLGLSGAALLTVGSATVAAIEIACANKSFETEFAGLRVLQALGELSAAAGVGLITFAVHRRVSLSPSLTGLTISGRF